LNSIQSLNSHKALNILGVNSGWVVPTAFLAVVVMTLIVLNGIRRSNFANIAIVSVTLLSLGFLILVCLPGAIQGGSENFTPFFTGSLADVLHASALMFVAYTGYGRIATLGEDFFYRQIHCYLAFLSSTRSCMSNLRSFLSIICYICNGKCHAFDTIKGTVDFHCLFDGFFSELANCTRDAIINIFTDFIVRKAECLKFL
jgi:hypothetical protein